MMMRIALMSTLAGVVPGCLFFQTPPVTQIEKYDRRAAELIVEELDAGDHFVVSHSTSEYLRSERTHAGLLYKVIWTRGFVVLADVVADLERCGELSEYSRTGKRALISTKEWAIQELAPVDVVPIIEAAVAGVGVDPSEREDD